VVIADAQRQESQEVPTDVAAEVIGGAAAGAIIAGSVAHSQTPNKSPLGKALGGAGAPRPSQPGGPPTQVAANEQHDEGAGEPGHTGPLAFNMGQSQKGGRKLSKKGHQQLVEEMGAMPKQDKDDDEGKTAIT
jgi:hypothetical protein